MVADQVLEEAYHGEEDGDVKERMLLVMRVRSDGVLASEACKELHRTKGWASKWLTRFDKKGLDGLRTRERSGRPMKLDHKEFVSVKRKVVRNECGWTVEDVRDMIREETDITYSERHTYRLMAKWGLRPIVPGKELLHKAPIEERMAFKKETQVSSGMFQKASRWYLRMSPSSS